MTKKVKEINSNLKNMADLESASNTENLIDLDDEVIIGLENSNKQVKKNKKQPKNIKAMQDKLKRKQKRAIRRLSMSMVLIISAVAGVLYLFVSPTFNVTTLEVLNNNHISTEKIINMSGIKLNESTFKFSTKKAENNILKNSYIKSVDVQRNIWENNVKIYVQERTPILMVKCANSYAYIDEQGYVLEISSNPINVPIVEGIETNLGEIKTGATLNEKDLAKIGKVANIISLADTNGLLSLVSKIDISNSRNYIMYMEQDGKTIYLGECTDLFTKMLYVKKMVEREKSVEGEFFLNIDLNYNKPVFREKV